MTALDELTALVPPPGTVIPGRAPEVWAGGPLPPDYVELVATYGCGVFDDFLWLLVPGMANRYLDLDHQTRGQVDALVSVRDGGEDMPYDIDSDNGHIVVWAMTDNGDAVCWRRDPGQAPADWTVVVNEGRGPEWNAFDGTATEFLLALLSGIPGLDRTVFPHDFPSDSPTFRPAG